MNATHWISVAQVIATAFVGVIAGVITYVMQSKQIDIAKGLREIARGQHETAVTKLRLELFEKRFAAYEEVVACMEEAYSYDSNKDHTYLEKNRVRFEKACAPMRYLFDQSVYVLLTVDITGVMSTYFSVINSMPQHIGTDEEEASFRTLHLHINETYETFNTLNKKVEPFLIIEKEKSLIA